MTIETIKNHESVNNVSNELNGKIFINLEGQQRNMRGDTTSKVWFDVNSEEICWKMGKGTCSSSFNQSLGSFKDSFEVIRKY